MAKAEGPPNVADRDPSRSPALRAELPGLEDAFDERIMREHLHATLCEGERRGVIERCERAQAVYAPGDGCVVRYQIQVRDRSSSAVIPGLVIGRLFADPRSAYTHLESRLAPLAGAVNVTVTPLSRLLLASFTVAASAVAKLVFTVVLCEAPPVAVMLEGLGETGGTGVDVESSKAPISGAAPE